MEKLFLVFLLLVSRGDYSCSDIIAVGLVLALNLFLVLEILTVK
jgi:hypothetical protein